MNSNINTLNNNNDNANVPQIDCKEKIKNIWNNIPLYVRFIMLSSLVIYLINLLIPIIGFYLANVPFYTIYKFQLWRVVTTSFLNTSIINILFGLLAWVSDGSSLERSMGTVKYMFTFVINGIMIQLIHTLVMFVIYLVLQTDKILSMNVVSGYHVENNGLWPIIMAEITLLCMANPNTPMRLFFFPCELQAKFYPFILFAFFVLISGFQIQFDLFAGILYGIIYIYLLKNKMNISDSFAKKCEGCFMFKWMKDFQGFIPVGSGQPVVMIRNTGATAVEQTGNVGENNAPTAMNNVNNNNNPSGFKAFQGKGVAVGGTLGLENGDYQGISQNVSSQV